MLPEASRGSYRVGDAVGSTVGFWICVDISTGSAYVVHMEMLAVLTDEVEGLVVVRVRWLDGVLVDAVTLSPVPMVQVLMVSAPVVVAG